MPAARQDYEALNAQLLDELPTMFRLADSLFRDSVCSFLYAQKQFTDNILKEMVAAGDKLVRSSVTLIFRIYKIVLCDQAVCSYPWW